MATLDGVAIFICEGTNLATQIQRLEWEKSPQSFVCSLVGSSVARKPKGTLTSRMPSEKDQQLFLHTQDRVLGSFGDPKLHDFLGLDLDRFNSSGIAADLGFAINQHQFAETWDGERVLGVFVRQGREVFENFNGLFFREAVLFSEFSGDL